ncbi:hypothetical protein CXG81DRAFT_20264 [Caulochytrium protostelioides]|uniref:Proteasome subunit alpha type n=1 Tax=Caulochytrium protostelioides TaxID=1555241 RepID=A0A4P9X0N4_9FUNG|nr:proteasome subunit alpha type-1 [Caulochytrium protostelioides]RKO99689.1 hypothetical protein CXG81DRAFT_20264 [Caulochytrium protostelioides]|eukprot:RKO99689.1 hypothetical protein CXG81DRAFT_20264 [Caulochytrium protostelioides]
MFRNQYDGDATTWSPQGRIHQVEYAMEAVKQGSAAVGLRSNTHAVLVSLNRSFGDLATHKEKLIKIDGHMGIAFSGLLSDARILSSFMRREALTSKMLYDRSVPVSRVVEAIGNKAQVNTQQYGNRPYGVGLLVAGHDETGPHIHECMPSGTTFDYVAMAIGSRSQSAKTYLEKHFESFASATLDELILHGVRALRDCLQQDQNLTVESCSVGVVGKDTPFDILDGARLGDFIQKVETTEGGRRGAHAVPVETSNVTPSETPAADQDTQMST